MAKLEIRTPEGIALRTELAGAGARFAAALIDGVLFALAYAGLLAVVSLAMTVGGGAISEFLQGLMITGTVLGYMLLTLILHALWRGQTIGKRVMGLRVVTVEGYPAGWLALTLRAIVLPIDVLVPLPIPGVLGLASIALSERRQRLGDMVAGTVVVSEAPSALTHDPFPEETWSGLEPKTLTLSPGLAARLDAEDFALLRDLLARDPLEPAQRRELFVKTARHYAGRLELGEFEDARVFLKELFLFLRDQRSAR